MANNEKIMKWWQYRHWCDENNEWEKLTKKDK